MEDKIRAAFEEIHADDMLIDKTLAYLHKKAEKRQKKSGKAISSIRLGAVAATVLLVVGVFSYNLYFTPAAHISIDVNPSVELTLNRFDRVIGAYAFNEDGAGILRESNLRGKTYHEAALLLLSIIEANGYMGGDALISVTVQAESGGKEQMLCEALLKFIGQEVLPDQASVEIEVFPVTAEVWGSARGCHMSPARFLAIQELMTVDEGAKMEDYEDISIRQIRRCIQECRNKHTEPSESNSESGLQNGHEYEHGQSQDHGNGQDQDSGQGQGQSHSHGHLVEH